MAVRKVSVPAATKPDVIEVLDKVYAVNGKMFRTETEAKLSLFKDELYLMYLDSLQYREIEKKTCLNKVHANNYAGVTIPINMVCDYLTEQKISFESEEVSK